MVKAPDDPRITDLARFKKARETQARRKPAKAPSPGLLGANPRAGLILAVIAVMFGAIWLWPLIQRVL
jgi:hypothetical protein